MLATCWQHVVDTRQCQQNFSDRAMLRCRHNFLPGHSHAFLCREMATFHSYEKVSYRREHPYQHTTTNSSCRHPTPIGISLLSLRGYSSNAIQSWRRRSPTPCAGHKPSGFGRCHRFDCWGGQKERDQKIEQQVGGCLGLRVATIF